MTEDISFLLALVGKPWVSGAAGPDAFDCWGLVKHVYSALRGIELPAFVGVDSISLLEATRFGEIQKGGTWEQLQTPTHLCAVAMSANRVCHHVGLWIQDGESGVILHAAQGKGVLIQSPASIKISGMQNIEFFSFKP